jgi:predicted outer membrane repeat protein
MRSEIFIRRAYQIALVTFLLVVGLAACDYPSTFIIIGCDVVELIDAINTANSDPNPDTIILDNSCLYELSEVDNLTDRQGLETGEDGATGLPAISTPITIGGNESRIVRSIAPGTPEFRIFFISTTGELTLNNVYVENGVVQSASNSNNGGAIHIRYGSLTLNQSYVMNNTAADLGGGIYVYQGTLTSNNTSISDNTADYGGAIANFDGTIMLDNYSVLVNNTASNSGGAIDNGGVLNVQDSHFDDNEAGLSGGAISCPGAGVGTGEVTLHAVLLNNNTAEAYGGAINIRSGFGPGCPFTITDSTFVQNQVITWDGGAIANQGTGSISDGTTFDGNIAQVSGGAIFNGLDGVLNLENSSVRNNETIDGSGGGISNFGGMTISSSTLDGNTSNAGGGIFNTGALTVTNSTVSNNVATGVYATPVFLSYALGDSDPDTILINTTVSGNQGELYGGVYIRGRGAIVYSTIVDNSCNRTGCGINFALDLGIVQIKNSIVANNVPGDCDFGASPPSSTSLGENLDSDGACPFFAITSHPLLGPLADNGGPTMTHALLSGSPAINAVTDCTDVSSNPVTVDQRWETRPSPLGGQCDIGAYEAPSLPVLPLRQSPTPTSKPRGEITFDTLCWHGPGSIYGTVQSMQAGTLVELVGLGEDGEHAVVYSTRYAGLKCWVPLRHILIPDTVGELPIIKVPSPPADEPESKPSPTKTPCEPGAPCP